jgi:hypothetical protein
VLTIYLAILSDRVYSYIKVKGDKMKAVFFKNKKDNKVTCSCCGKKIMKGYTIGIRNVGEDCFVSISLVINMNITAPRTLLGIQKMHIDWIKA